MSGIWFWVLAWCADVQSWGYVGHRIVGHIAEQHMSKKNLKLLREVLPESLSEGATWADSIRSDRDLRVAIARRWRPEGVPPDAKTDLLAEVVNMWHYISIDDDQELDTIPRQKLGDVEHGISEMIRLLKSKKLSPRGTREALRLLAHFVGDVHQPLHVGNTWDKGGNNCWIKWFPEKYRKNILPPPKKSVEYLNLHALWDTKLIESVNLSAKEYATHLSAALPEWLADSEKDLKEYLEISTQDLRELRRKKIQKWMKDPPEEWIRESKNLRPQVYIGKIGEDGKYKYCFERFTEKIDDAKIPRVSWDERYRFLRIAERRLIQAGVRLAATLESVL